MSLSIKKLNQKCFELQLVTLHLLNYKKVSFVFAVSCLRLMEIE